jgi:hypothetical protein
MSTLAVDMVTVIRVWSRGNARAADAVAGVLVHGRKTAVVASELAISRQMVEKYVGRFRAAAASALGERNGNRESAIGNRETTPPTLPLCHSATLPLPREASG